ncbi:MAG: hypothetical protein J5917_04345 [Bacteroidales bacterium]|nr:hypothetical protein [Bacteroidales bacterium]
MGQFDALSNSVNTNAKTYSQSWKTGWTSLGSTKGGMLITSKKNGLSLFFAAAGYYYDGSLSTVHTQGDYGYCWSSSPLDDENPGAAMCLYFNNKFFYWYDEGRPLGIPVRPVKNK